MLSYTWVRTRWATADAKVRVVERREQRRKKRPIEQKLRRVRVPV